MFKIVKVGVMARQEVVPILRKTVAGIKQKQFIILGECLEVLPHLGFDRCLGRGGAEQENLVQRGSKLQGCRKTLYVGLRVLDGLDARIVIIFNTAIRIASRFVMLRFRED